MDTQSQQINTSTPFSPLLQNLAFFFISALYNRIMIRKYKIIGVAHSLY